MKYNNSAVKKQTETDTKKVILLAGAAAALLVGTLLILLLKDNLLGEDTQVSTESVDIAINTDDGDEKIDWSGYERFNYTLSDSLVIDRDGVYNLTGKIDDGLITIKVPGNVKLVLDEVEIANADGPAIYIESAEDVVIELVEGTENYLSDGESYAVDNDAGTIYSKSDLTIQGGGALKVVANNEDAVVSKDDLKIVGGNYEIVAADDGIRGKDSVYIKDGSFVIDAKGDGIKATNTERAEKGFIKIENGVFNITAGLDGVQAETKLLIEDGEFEIKTGGGSVNASSDQQNATWGNWGPREMPMNKSTQNQIDTASAKGIKAANNLVIKGGTFSFDSSDDAIHSNNDIGIKSGNFAIKSGDDGIHADSKLIIDNGEINVTKSYEGLEAAEITINDGTIKIAATDDGINVAGGNDSSAMGRPGQNNFSEQSGNILRINGGDIYVDAAGDGLDANGSIYVNGGVVQVDGPVDDGNGALDYEGVFEANGGTLMAGGASGMAQGVSESSKLYSVNIFFNKTYGKNDEVTILDDENREIIAYATAKNFSSLVVASPEFKKGETYTIAVNGETYQSFTISSIMTQVGNGGFNMNGAPGGRGGPGDMNAPGGEMGAPR